MKKPVQVFSYNFSNHADTKTVDIHIDGEIVDASTQAMIQAIFGDNTTTSYKSFRNSIDKINADVYNVIINSPGGHVGDAMAMADMITELQNKGKIVNTKGIGIVASSATLILMAGKSPEMSANSWWMMHTVSGGTYGTVDQVENYAATMRKFNNKVRDSYAEKSGQRPEEVTKLMNKETWLTAQEAKDKGFIASVSGDAAFTNKIESENWEFENTTVLVKYNDSVKPTNDNSLIMKLTEMFAAFKNEVKDAITALKGKNLTNEQMATEIGNIVTDKMENLGKNMDTAITDSVNAVVTGDVFKAALKLQVENAAKEALTALETRVKKTEDNLEVLENDELLNKGAKTGAGGGTGGNEAPTNVGGFSFKSVQPAV